MSIALAGEILMADAAARKDVVLKGAGWLMVRSLVFSEVTVPVSPTWSKAAWASSNDWNLSVACLTANSPASHATVARTCQ